jgi:hypothetical protein
MHVISVFILSELHNREKYGGNIFPTFEDLLGLLFIMLTRKNISLSLKCQIYSVRFRAGIPVVKYALGWN